MKLRSESRSRTRTFVAVFNYVEDMLGRRAPYRVVHLEGLQRLAEAGALRFAGAWMSPLDGAIWVVDAEAQHDVEELIRKDSYVVAGLVVSWTVREVSPAPMASKTS